MAARARGIVEVGRGAEGTWNWMDRARSNAKRKPVSRGAILDAVIYLSLAIVLIGAEALVWAVGR